MAGTWSGADSVTRRDQGGEDFIAAVFIVTFDVRKGNIVQWKYPEDVEVPGVEFKSMPSGSHAIENDFVFFSVSSALYGLSCFACRRDASVERGMQARALGILCAQYTNLNQHLPFLQAQTRALMEDLEGYSYDALIQHYNTYRDNPSIRPDSIRGIGSPARPVASGSALPTEAVYHVTYPEGCFSKFLDTFGPKIFVLWRFVLLRRRILFLSRVPVGDSCQKVYSTCLLAAQTVQLGPHDRKMHPLFYITLIDIASLEGEECFAACVTEDVFEDKTRLYDAYVKGSSISSKVNFASLLRLNDADKRRFQSLKEAATSPAYSAALSDGSPASIEDRYIRFFLQLNDTLFQTLSDASQADGSMLTAERIAELGLHPSEDSYFVSELARLYSPSVIVEGTGGCC